jgi:hypothetical protein
MGVNGSMTHRFSLFLKMFAAPLCAAMVLFAGFARADHYDSRVYFSRPRSSFAISFGTGYAGRGYYYGPPGAPYYYRAPGVVFYRTRAAIPRYYIERHHYVSVEVSVQRALARRGYYRGPIDGDIGPRSRRAIASYQADHGLRPTGRIDSSLLRSLRI